jgi:hypothetical protein
MMTYIIANPATNPTDLRFATRNSRLISIDHNGVYVTSGQ